MTVFKLVKQKRVAREAEVVFSALFFQWRLPVVFGRRHFKSLKARIPRLSQASRIAATFRS